MAVKLFGISILLTLVLVLLPFGAVWTQSGQSEAGRLVVVAAQSPTESVPVAPSGQETVAGGAESDPAAPVEEKGVTVSLEAASERRIDFHTGNGGQNPGEALPHLVLYRNSALTDPSERTLIVQVNGVEPSSEVTLEIKTQHMDLSAGNPQFITVWRESKSSADAGGVTFACEFTEQVTSGDMIGQATPTDYFEVTIGVNGQPVPGYGPRRYAFLMENQEAVDLPGLSREGATPYELIVYYCDMFPFGWGMGKMLDRNAVLDYVHNQLTPEMVRAIVTQTNDWDMGPWRAGWNGRRRGENGEYERRLSVAMGLNGEWYHGPGTEGKVGGHDFITIKAARFEPAYADLLDVHMSVFFHELFHNLQRNVGSVVSWDEAFTTSGSPWQFFSEGQAVLATSVGQPDPEFVEVLDYVKLANEFLEDELNTSYLSADPARPYRTAIYWRFLYEQCGGMSQGGVENQAAGMQVVRRSLERLFSDAEATSAGFVQAMDRIMDQVFESGACPAFGTYEESIIAFARANYALRLANGRCTAPGIPAGCGYYDPHEKYTDRLPLEQISYSGAYLSYDGSVPASFGMDFVEVALDTDGQSATLEFQSDEANASFNVQVWKLVDGAASRRFPDDTASAEILTSANADGHLVYLIPEVRGYDKLALIVTRLDTDDTVISGGYEIVLEPNG